MARDDVDVTLKDNVCQQHSGISLCLTIEHREWEQNNQHIWQAITLFQYKNGFHIACENGYTEMAKQLAKYVDVNLKDKVS